MHRKVFEVVHGMFSVSRFIVRSIVRYWATVPQKRCLQYNAQLMHGWTVPSITLLKRFIALRSNSFYDLPRFCRPS